MDRSITELLWGILAVLALDFETTHGDDENLDQSTMNLIDYVVRNLVMTEATGQVIMGDSGNTGEGNEGGGDSEYPAE